MTIPETSLASAVPRDDGHVGGDGHAPDYGLLVLLGPAGDHASSGVASLSVPHSQRVCAACHHVHIVRVPGDTQYPTLLSVKHLCSKSFLEKYVFLST